MPNLTMIDFAFPVSPPPVKTDIVLVYAGGDTPHVMTDAEMAEQPARYRLPTWVRSNPSGQLQAQSDTRVFHSWLLAHKVPVGTTVLIDLEIAVNASYVNAFNTAMTAVGYKVMKYGSLDYIFKNPKTSGGTFVANPTGKEHMITEGDTVATQYLFAGAYDLSIVLPSVPLWDTKPVVTEPALAKPVPRDQFTLEVIWPAITGANGYHYEVVNVHDQVIADESTFTPSFAIPHLIAGIYKYRVATHATQTERASGWSDWVTVNFT